MFSTNQLSCSRNGLQLQLIRYDTSIDVDAPNQLLTLSMNWSLGVPNSPKLCSIEFLVSDVGEAKKTGQPFLPSHHQEKMAAIDLFSN